MGVRCVCKHICGLALGPNLPILRTALLIGLGMGAIRVPGNLGDPLVPGGPWPESPGRSPRTSVRSSCDQEKERAGSREQTILSYLSASQLLTNYCVSVTAPQPRPGVGRRLRQIKKKKRRCSLAGD